MSISKAATTTGEPSAALDVESIRKDFPILQTQPAGKPLIYLDNAASTQRPRQVIDALSDVYEKHYANVHRGIHWLSERATDLYEAARQSVKDFINANTLAEVIFTTGATGAINLVARSWGDEFVKQGDEILLSQMEHHSNIVPWQQLAARTGCVIKFIPVTADGLLDLSTLDQLLTSRTKMLSITAVSNVLGTINPLAELIEKAHAAGALVMVDGAQSAPHETVDVQQLGADFYAFSGHKMLGPSGVGVLWGRETLLESMPPFLGGGSMISDVRLDGFKPAGLPTRFEAGTPPIVPAIGLTAAIDYLQSIGLNRIAAHETMLTTRAQEKLSQIEDLQFFGPQPDQKAGIVSFVMKRPHAHDVAQMLDRDGIAIRAGHHCAQPLHKLMGVTASNRASFYLYNTTDEVDQLAESIGKLRAFFSGNRKRKRRPKQQ